MSSGNRFLEEQQQRRYARRLVRAMSPFKPYDATPLQFYNYVKEICIDNHCDLDVGMVRAVNEWPFLSSGMKEIFKSEYLGTQLIPDYQDRS